MGQIDFTRKLLQENLRQKELEYERHKGAKEFADRLAAARAQDDKEFAEQLRTCPIKNITGLLLQKLYDVGYKEAVEMYEHRIISQ